MEPGKCQVTNTPEAASAPCPAQETALLPAPPRPAHTAIHPGLLPPSLPYTETWGSGNENDAPAFVTAALLPVWKMHFLVVFSKLFPWHF